MDPHHEQDLLLRISTLQERLVEFYAIQSDVECDKAKAVLQTQINNYNSALERLEKELLKLK
jgi:hypothetical protein